MKLSVILITHNTREMTLASAAAARRALDAAGFGSEAELMVVDNGSTDGTADALAALVPPPRLVRAATNLGYGRAANLGARGASGSVLLFLNSDVTLTPEAVKALHAAFLAHPRAGAVGAFLLNPDGTPQHAADGIPTLLSELTSKSVLRALLPARYPVVRAEGLPVRVPTLVGACQALSREAFDAVGGFDERFFFFLEETDLCIRLRHGGWEVLVAPSARVVHGQGRTARRAGPRARVEYDLSRYRFFRKHHGPVAVAVLFAGTLVRLTAGVLLNGIALVLTAGLAPRLRERAARQGYRLAWHLALCPPGWGLEGLTLEPDAAPAREAA